MDIAEKDNEAVLSEIKLAEWREGVKQRREELFRRKWKNSRPTPLLRSRQQDRNFQFVVEWYEEFDEIVAREREKNRLDKLNSKNCEFDNPPEKVI